MIGGLMWMMFSLFSPPPSAEGAAGAAGGAGGGTTGAGAGWTGAGVGISLSALIFEIGGGGGLVFSRPLGGRGGRTFFSLWRPDLRKRREDGLVLSAVLVGTVRAHLLFLRLDERYSLRHYFRCRRRGIGWRRCGGGRGSFFIRPRRVTVALPRGE